MVARRELAISYLVLSVRVGQRLPGKTTIPDRISANKKPYYQALESADGSIVDSGDEPDLSEMESLLSRLLAAQVQDAARSELPRETLLRNHRDTSNTTGASFFARHKVAVSASAVIIAAIVTGIFTLLSTDSGQRLLLKNASSSSGSASASPR